MAEKAILVKIENDRDVIWNSDYEFFFTYQKAVLLALQELGTLDNLQYQYAEDTLIEQFRKMTKKNFS